MPGTHPVDGAARLTPALRARKFYAAERYLAKLVASEPQLDADQRRKLADLLTAGAER
jgi:hypothetical protein